MCDKIRLISVYGGRKMTTGIAQRQNRARIRPVVAILLWAATLE